MDGRPLTTLVPPWTIADVLLRRCAGILRACAHRHDRRILSSGGYLAPHRLWDRFHCGLCLLIAMPFFLFVGAAHTLPRDRERQARHRMAAREAAPTASGSQLSAERARFQRCKATLPRQPLHAMGLLSGAPADSARSEERDGRSRTCCNALAASTRNSMRFSGVNDADKLIEQAGPAPTPQRFSIASPHRRDRRRCRRPEASESGRAPGRWSRGDSRVGCGNLVIMRCGTRSLAAC